MRSLIRFMMTLCSSNRIKYRYTKSKNCHIKVYLINANWNQISRDYFKNLIAIVNMLIVYAKVRLKCEIQYQNKMETTALVINTNIFVFILSNFGVFWQHSDLKINSLKSWKLSINLCIPSDHERIWEKKLFLCINNVWCIK